MTVNAESEPKKVRLITDDYHLAGLGRLSDGTFFLVSPQLNFDISTNKTADYLCKFCFNSEGNLTDSEILKLGVRGHYDVKETQTKYLSLLPKPDTYSDSDFFIKPFTVDFDGLKFGFIVRAPEGDEDVWAIEYMPGNTIAFFFPWNDGEYDT